jgi:hypothetical protein
MDSSRSLCGIIVPSCGISRFSSDEQEECKMNATTVAINLAKNVFQLAVADVNWRVVEASLDG